MKSALASRIRIAPRALLPDGAMLRLAAKRKRQPAGTGLLYDVELRNPASAPVALDRVVLFDLDLGVQTLDVYRQGFFMPSDPAGFFRLRAGEPVPSEGSWKPADETGHRFTSHSVVVVKAPDSPDMTLLGFVSFERFQGYWVLDTSGRTVRLQACVRLEGQVLDPTASLRMERFLAISGREFNDCLDRYAEHVAAVCCARVPRETVAGWTDWQFYREEKSADVILENVRVLRRLRRAGYPLRYVIIDGGWCEHASEWLRPCAKFPDIGGLCRRIRRAGLVPGLWFAPYLTNVETEVARKHPEWMLLDAQTGKPLRKPGSNVGPCHVLDYSVPAALEWLRGIVRVMVRDWKIGYLKLDGPCLAHYRGGRFHDPGVTAVEQVRRSLAVLREECGVDVLIEGEGIYGPSIGFVDTQRTTQDTHPCWHIPESGTPLLKENLGNDLLGSFQHGRFWHVHRENVVLRDFPSPFHAGKARNPRAVESLLTENQLRSQLSACTLAGGAMLLTDPLPALERSPERFALIARFLPPCEGLRCRVLDPFFSERFPSRYLLTVERPFGRWHVLGVFNWGDMHRDFEVPLQAWIGAAPHHAFEFWDSADLGMVRRRLVVKNVPAHGCRMIALRPVCCALDGTPLPQLVGTDLHLLQGAVELEALETSCESLRIVVDHFDPAERSLFVHVPPGWTLRRLRTDARDVLVDDRNPSVLRIRFSPGGCRTSFTLEWSSPREAMR